MVVLHGAPLCIPCAQPSPVPDPPSSQHCQIVPDDSQPAQGFASSSTTVTISVQAFTPILGTLLLSSNPLVGGAARFAVVDLLSRMKKADDRQLGANSTRHHQHLPGDILHPWEIPAANCNDDDDDDDDKLRNIGLFRGEERAMFTQEILQQVVIGMGRLDVDFAPPEEIPVAEGVAPAIKPDEDYNPYFPPFPPPMYYPAQSFHDVSPSQLRPPSSAQNAYSPGTEFPPEADRPPATSPRIPIASDRPVGDPPSSDAHSDNPGSPMNTDADW